MTNDEREKTFINGMFVLNSIQPDIYIVTTGSPRKNRNSYPQYLLYTETDKIHVFEKKELFTTNQNTWKPRKMKFEKKKKATYK